MSAEAETSGGDARVMGWRSWTLLVVIAVITWLLVDEYALTLTSMGSDSMKPTLVAGDGAPDVVLVDRITHHLREPVRGEIVRFRSEDGKWVMKRVVGLPGEVIEIRQGKIIADGREVTAPPEVAQRSYVNDGHLEAGVQLRVSPDHYLVLGDDSQDSYDSRYWGCLARARVHGIGRAVVWPPARIAGLAPSS